MGEDGPSLLDLVQEYARTYFAAYPNVFETRPDEFRREDFVGLSPLAKPVVEMVVTEWVARGDELVAPFHIIANRLREGPPPSPELAEAIDELRSLSPEKLRERVRWLMGLGGDLHFGACVSLFWAAIQDDDRRAAEAHLKAVLGPTFVERLAARGRAPEGEARTAAMQAAYDVLLTAAERRDRASNQRAVFRTAVARQAKLRLADAPPSEFAPERVAREAASLEAGQRPAAPQSGDPLSTAGTEIESLISRSPRPDEGEARGFQDLKQTCTEKWGLTPRETDFALALALAGSPTTAEVARDFGITEKTGWVHARNIREKIKASKGS